MWSGGPSCQPSLKVGTGSRAARSPLGAPASTQATSVSISLKTLCWKIGESFVKTSNNQDDVYGHLWATRKARELERNAAGEFSDQAKAKLEKFKIGTTTTAYRWYAGCLTADHCARLLSELPAKREALTRKLAGPVGRIGGAPPRALGA